MSTAGAAAPVSLDFSGKGKGWDDRELVNAYDAALLEFHIHHPGPGSWLDKATAALAKGQPLPGANAFGTSWYSAAKEPEAPAEEVEAELEPERPEPPTQRKKKQKTRKSDAGYINSPYAPPARSRPPNGRSPTQSPSYQPASPPTARAALDEDEESMEDERSDDDHDIEEPAEQWQGYDGHGNQVGAEIDEAEQIFPPPSGEWAGGTGGPVSRDEAVGYALHAQYWAGYWMGVARGAAAAPAVEAQDLALARTKSNLRR